MKLITIQTLSPFHKQAVMDLWNREYPRRLAQPSIEHFEAYLSSLSQVTHFVFEEQGRVLGWASLFNRDAQWWFAVIITSEAHGHGLGTRALDELKKQQDELYGWVIDREDELKSDGTLYRSPIEFYQKKGFLVLENERLELPTLSAVKIRWGRSSL